VTTLLCKRWTGKSDSTCSRSRITTFALRTCQKQQPLEPRQPFSGPVFISDTIIVWCRSANHSTAKFDMFVNIRMYVCIHLCMYVCSKRSRGSSGSIVSGYGLGNRVIEVRSPAGAKDFFPRICVQTGSGPTQPPVQWVPGVLSPGVKRGRGVTLTTHPHKVSRLWMSRIYTSSPPSASMACSGTALLLYVCSKTYHTYACMHVCTYVLLRVYVYIYIYM
jgi:hypothetical protein